MRLVEPDEEVSSPAVGIEQQAVDSLYETGQLLRRMVEEQLPCHLAVKNELEDAIIGLDRLAGAMLLHWYRTNRVHFVG